MVYKILITPDAKRCLDRYVGYTANVLQNKKAASSIIEDFRGTIRRLKANPELYAFCSDPRLKELGYRKIYFRKHDFFMVYRIEKNNVIIDRMFHELQDYEAIFTEYRNK